MNLIFQVLQYSTHWTINLLQKIWQDVQNNLHTNGKIGTS